MIRSKLPSLLKTSKRTAKQKGKEGKGPATATATDEIANTETPPQ